MKNIPIRHIKNLNPKPDLTGNFNIRKIEELLDGNDLEQDLHRHDFFLIIFLKKKIFLKD